MKKIFLLIVITMTCFGDYASIWQNIQEDVLQNDLDGIEVFVSREEITKGTKIANWRGSHKAPIDGYFFFIDKFPEANWEHPCLYVFANKQKIEIVEELAPPYILEDMIEIVDHDWSRRNYHKAPRTVFSVPRPARSMDLDNCWAVLISGGGSISSNYARYYNDIVFIYETLIGYGYHDDHIIVLFADGTDPSPDQPGGINSNPDLDGDGDDDIQFATTLENLNTVFSTLASILTHEDQLFIYSTDHGGGGGEDDWDVYLVGWGENIDDYIFAAMIEDIDCSSIIITMEQCYSGGFLDDLAGDGRVIATACRYDEVSWSGVEHSEYDEFVYHWTSGVNGETPFGETTDADYNEDGYISMEEAFIYAEANDAARETPQYSSMPEDFGSYTFLFGSISSEPYIIKNSDIWGEITGDGDDIPDPGEIFYYIPGLMNIGTDAIDVSLTLSSDCPHIEILDNNIEWHELAAYDTTVWYSDSFKVSILPTADYGDSFQFSIDLLEASGYANEYSIFQKIHRPSVMHTNSIIVDADGDDDGFVDPGERVNMFVFLRNNSLQEIIALNSTITSSDANITIHENATVFGDLFPGNELPSIMPIEFTLSASAMPYSILEFDMILSGASGFSDTIDINIQASSQFTYPNTESEELWDIDGWNRTYFRQIKGDFAWYCGNEDIYRYSDYANNKLTSAFAVLIPESPILIYSEFLAVEPGYDYARVKYSTDGYSFHTVSEKAKYTPPWQTHIVDLSEIDSEEAYIRFEFESDGGVHSEGWYIDNISVQSDPGRGLFGGHSVQPYGLSGDLFKFRVTWYDSSGAMPEIYNLVIGDSEYPMEPLGFDASKGITYQASINLYASDIADFEFHFDELVIGPFEGPRILASEEIITISSDPSAFTHSGTVDEWDWGIPTGLPASGAPVPGNVWATELTGNYQNLMQCRLQSPSIDISDMINPYIIVKQWYRFNEISSGSVLAGAGNVKFQSTSMAEPYVLMPVEGYDCVTTVNNFQIPGEDGFGGYSNGSFWHSEIFSLLPIDDESFNLIFDAGGRSAYSGEMGWYVSDIHIIDAMGLNIGEEFNGKPDIMKFALSPNPFNSAIKITLSGRGQSSSNIIKFLIYDIKGNLIDAILSNSSQAIWQPKNIQSGIYLISTSIGGEKYTQKAIYLK